MWDWLGHDGVLPAAWARTWSDIAGGQPPCGRLQRLNRSVPIAFLRGGLLRAFEIPPSLRIRTVTRACLMEDSRASGSRVGDLAPSGSTRACSSTPPARRRIAPSTKSWRNSRSRRRGRRAGRIDMALLTRCLAFADYDFYLCGPAAFTQALYDGLRATTSRTTGFTPRRSTPRRW